MKWINFLQRLLQRFFPKKNEIIEVKYIERDETRVLPDIPENVIAACQTLQVKLDSVKNNPFLEISLIYGFLDTFGEFASTFTVCQKGCSACCKIGVEMTALEASFIEKNTSHRIVSNKQRKLKTNTDCPFLIDGICSIYEYRPFNCRTFFTVDNPKHCETPNEPHRTYGSLGGQDINIIYQFRKYIDHLNGKRKKSDIRFFFGNHKGIK